MKSDTKFVRFLHHPATVHLNTALAFFALLLFLSCHSVLGFMGHYTFPALPYILGGVLGVSALLSLIMTLTKRNDVLLIITGCVNILLFVISLAYFLGFSSNYKSIFVEFGQILIYYAFAAIVLYFACFHHKTGYRGRKVVAVVLLVALFGGSILCFTDFNTLHFNYISDGPVVYAVEDDYQIVWRTSVKGTGWVEVGGQTFNDTYAGSMRSTTRIHKVTLPQQALDEAGGYSIHSRAMISEQSWSGLQGREISKSYAFTPVDPSDGIRFYAVSDVHDFASPAVKALQYGQENGGALDFVVMAGDMNNYTESEFDLSRILNLAHRLSGGTRPVVFARGNHELKAVGSESLHRYVGAIGEQFYYTFRLKNVWGVVLDMGEDHADDWYEFYGTARFDAYRAQQLDFLDAVIADASNQYAAPDVTYRIGVCHVSTAISPYDEPYMYDQLVEVNERLNRMSLDVMISGHLHQAFKIEGDYEVGEELRYDPSYWPQRADEIAFVATGARYPSILCARRARLQDPSKSESLYGAHYIGVCVTLDGATKRACFNNSKGEVINSRSPFANKNYGTLVPLN